MIFVECDRCFARLRYDESRFDGRPSKRLRCPKCHAVFEAYNTHAWESLSPLRGVALPDVDASDAAAPAEAVGETDRLVAGEERLPANTRVSLAVISGPHAGTIFRIEKPRVVVGRSGADVVLDDPEISREHAALEIGKAGARLVDLGSSTGTFVGDRRVPEARIENRGEFTVGGSTLMLIVTETPSP